MSKSYPIYPPPATHTPSYALPSMSATAFLRSFPPFPLPNPKQGIWGPVDIRAWVSTCGDIVLLLILLGLISSLPAACRQNHLDILCQELQVLEGQICKHLLLLYWTQNEVLTACKRNVCLYYIKDIFYIFKLFQFILLYIVCLSFSSLNA